MVEIPSRFKSGCVHVRTYDGLEYDEKIGWYDPNIAYCIKGDGRPAVDEKPVGMFYDNFVTELVCSEHK